MTPDQKTVLKFVGKHRREMVDPLYARELEAEIDAMNLPETIRADLLVTLRNHTAAPCKWTFIMLSPQQNAAVVSYLSENSKRPREAVLLWAHLFTVMRMDTGEILMRRDELAETLNMTPANVSRIMSELTDINAIKRSRERVKGMKGPGMVRYFMSSQIATGVHGEANRAAARDRDGQLTIFDVIEGGRND